MKRGIQTFLAAGCLGLLAACASNPNKAKEIDDKLDVKGGVMGSAVGVDKDQQMVVQTKTDADIEIRNQIWKNSELKQHMVDHYQQDRQCHQDKADPRLGGSGNVQMPPELDAVESAIKHEDQLGLDANGHLVVVQKEMLKDKLDGLRKDGTALEAADRMIQHDLETCHNEVGVMRVAHGLPRDKYPGKGYYQNGVYVPQRRAEQSLDDAFQFAAEDRQQPSLPAQTHQ